MPDEIDWTPVDELAAQRAWARINGQQPQSVADTDDEDEDDGDDTAPSSKRQPHKRLRSLPASRRSHAQRLFLLKGGAPMNGQKKGGS